jgi:antitoxin component YwqK of YwqJK toxin-antitoxin module
MQRVFRGRSILFFLVAALFFTSFKKENKTGYPVDSSIYYDSISYYPDSSLKFARTNGVDYSFYPNGNLALRRQALAYYWYETRYDERGVPVLDSTVAGSMRKQVLYDGSGKTKSITLKNPGADRGSFEEKRFEFDSYGNISNYSWNDLSGHGSLPYPAAQFSNMKYYIDLYPGKDYGRVTREHGFYTTANDTAAWIRYGLWQVYYPNGKLKSLTYYSNGLENGVAVQFDEGGKIMTFDFYRDGIKDEVRKRNFFAKDTVFIKPQKSNHREFFESGRPNENGFLMDVYDNGYAWQFVYFVDGESIHGASFQAASYYNEAQFSFGIHHGLKMEIRVLHDQVLSKTLTDGRIEFSKETYMNGKLHTRQSVNGYRDYFHHDGHNGIRFHSIPPDIKVWHDPDSSVWYADTVNFYGGGMIVYQEISGLDYHRKMQNWFNVQKYWEARLDPGYYKRYIKLPNGKWFEVHQTNLRLPGEVVHISLYSVVIERSFWTTKGMEGAFLKYSPKTGKLISRMYFRNHRQCGPFEVYSEEGKLLEKGKFNRRGKESGVHKKYNANSGKKELRERYIAGETWGIVYKNCCCLTRKKHGVPHREFHIAGMKIMNLRVCKKRKYTPF